MGGALVGGVAALIGLAVVRLAVRVALPGPAIEPARLAAGAAILGLGGALIAFALRRWAAARSYRGRDVSSGAVLAVVSLLLLPAGRHADWHGLPALPPSTPLDGPPGSGLRYAVNGAGFRGPAELPTGRALADIPRIAVLGDSFVFGMGVPDEATLTARLADLLPAARIVNLGVPGANLETHGLAAAAAVAELDVDALIVVITGANDFARWDAGRELRALRRPGALRAAALLVGERRAREAAWALLFDPGPRTPGPAEAARLSAAVGRIAALGPPVVVLPWRLADTPAIRSALASAPIRVAPEPDWDDAADYLRDGHPSAAGHARAAAALAPHVRAALAGEAPPGRPDGADAAPTPRAPSVDPAGSAR